MKRNLLKNKLGDVGVIGVLIGILISIVIGMLVFWTIVGSITTSDASAIAALANVNNTAVTVFNLAPIEIF